MTDGGNRGVSELPAHLPLAPARTPAMMIGPSTTAAPRPSPADAEPGAALESAPVAIRRFAGAGPASSDPLATDELGAAGTASESARTGGALDTRQIS